MAASLRWRHHVTFGDLESKFLWYYLCMFILVGNTNICSKTLIFWDINDFLLVHGGHFVMTSSGDLESNFLEYNLGMFILVGNTNICSKTLCFWVIWCFLPLWRPFWKMWRHTLFQNFHFCKLICIRSWHHFRHFKLYLVFVAICLTSHWPTM